MDKKIMTKNKNGRINELVTDKKAKNNETINSKKKKNHKLEVEKGKILKDGYGNKYYYEKKNMKKGKIEYEKKTAINGDREEDEEQGEDEYENENFD